MRMTEQAKSMRIVDVPSPGGAEVLEIREVAAPYPEADEVLIKVHAAGVNRPDLLQRQGLYRAPKHANPILGLEVAGTIEAVGRDTVGFDIGHEVVALTNGGGYADYVTVPFGQVLPLPKPLNLIEGASLPETLFTTYQVLIQRCGLSANHTVLIHGGSSGIGGMALQLAQSVGAKAYCTVSTDQKAEYAMQMGASHVINYLEQDFEAELLKLTDGRGVDIILDIVGGDYLNRNLRCLAQHGQLIQLALLGGASSEINLGQLLMKQLTVFGSLLRPQPVETKADIAKALKREIWPQIESGKFKLPSIRTFPFEKVIDAHRAMEAKDHFGKIVLTT